LNNSKYCFLYRLPSKAYLAWWAVFLIFYINHSNQYQSFDGEYEIELKHLYNAYYYCYNVSIDLLLFSNSILRASKNSIRKQYLRFLSVIIYESIKDFSSVVNQETLVILREVLNEHQQKQLDNILYEIRVFRKHWEKEFRLIRNAIGAHRENNVLLFEEYMKELDYKTVLVISNLFNSLIFNIVVLLLISMEKLVKK